MLGHVRLCSVCGMGAPKRGTHGRVGYAVVATRLKRAEDLDNRYYRSWAPISFKKLHCVVTMSV